MTSHMQGLRGSHVGSPRKLVKLMAGWLVFFSRDAPRRHGTDLGNVFQRIATLYHSHTCEY